MAKYTIWYDENQGSYGGASWQEQETTDNIEKAVKSLKTLIEEHHDDDISSFDESHYRMTMEIPLNIVLKSQAEVKATVPVL